MSKKTPMTQPAASRIQSHADKSGKNSGFKARASKAAASNSGKGGAKSGKGSTKGGGGKR